MHCQVRRPGGNAGTACVVPRSADAGAAAGGGRRPAMLARNEEGPASVGLPGSTPRHRRRLCGTGQSMDGRRGGEGTRQDLTSLKSVEPPIGVPARSRGVAMVGVLIGDPNHGKGRMLSTFTSGRRALAASADSRVDSRYESPDWAWTPGRFSRDKRRPASSPAAPAVEDVTRARRRVGREARAVTLQKGSVLVPVQFAIAEHQFAAVERWDRFTHGSAR